MSRIQKIAAEWHKQRTLLSPYDGNDEAMEEAAFELADAMAAELDPTEIDEAFVIASGFTNTGTPSWPVFQSLPSMAGGPVCAIRWQPYSGCDGWSVGYVGEWALVPPRETRGQLRHLAAALQIELKEGAR
jgi:hypothetical protein